MSAIGGLIDLSARLANLHVVLCSLQTRLDQVAARVAATRQEHLLVEIPRQVHISDMPSRTSAPLFNEASEAESDLSTKRNLGLLLARLNGWSKIAFLDSSITLAIRFAVDASVATLG